MKDPIPSLDLPRYEWYVQACAKALRQAARESRLAKYEQGHDLRASGFIGTAVALGIVAQAIEPPA